MSRTSEVSLEAFRSEQDAMAEPAEYAQGLLDTNTVILRRWTHPRGFSRRGPISAVTLAELSAGLREVRKNEERERLRRTRAAGRLSILQRAENEFGPYPFDTEAARIYGKRRRHRRRPQTSLTGRRPQKPLAY